MIVLLDLRRDVVSGSTVELLSFFVSKLQVVLLHQSNTIGLTEVFFFWDRNGLTEVLILDNNLGALKFWIILFVDNFLHA